MPLDVDLRRIDRLQHYRTFFVRLRVLERNLLMDLVLRFEAGFFGARRMTAM